MTEIFPSLGNARAHSMLPCRAASHSRYWQGMVWIGPCLTRFKQKFSRIEIFQLQEYLVSVSGYNFANLTRSQITNISAFAINY